MRRKKSKNDDVVIDNPTPQPDKVRQMLREQSFSRRGQIRDDIEKQQAKALKKDKRLSVAAV